MNMNKFLYLVFIYCLSVDCLKAQRMADYNVFPVSQNVQQTEWQRLTWKRLKLDDPCNRGLYCTSVEGKGLFALILNLAVNGNVPLYKFVVDGNESLEDKDKISIEQVFDDFNISYTNDNGKIVAENIPAADVKDFYICETTAYNAVNSSFSTKVTAICPLLTQLDDYEDRKSLYPMFWVNYNDLLPFMDGWAVKEYRGNGVANIPLKDFFLLNLYHGDIYKSFSPQGETFIQQCEGNDDAARKMSGKAVTDEMNMKAYTFDVFSNNGKDW